VFELIFGKSGPSNNPKKTSVVLKHMITLVLYCDVRDADNDIIDILEKATQRFRLKHVPRFVFFGGPALGMFLLTYLVVVLLYRVVVNSPGSYLGLALLIALGIGLLQPRIWAFFPNYVPPESASHLWTPEYIRGETKAEKKAAQRRLDDEWN